MKMQQKVKSNNSVLLIVAVWVLILVAAFLAYHSEDVGGVTNLLASLTKGTLFGAAGFSESVIGFLVACLIVATWYGLGSTTVITIQKIIDRQTGGSNSQFLNSIRNCSLGAAVWSLFWFFIGLANGDNAAFAIISLSIGLILCALPVYRFWQTRKSIESISATDVVGKTAFAIMFFVLFLTLISAIAPPTAKDALLYHFAVPKTFVSAGSSAVIQGNIASYLALGTEMQVVWAMLLGNIISFRVGEIAGSVTVFAFFPLLLAAIYGWARELGLDKTFAIISALLVATIPTAYYVASNGYIDLALALYITLAIHAVSRWWKTLGNEWLVYTALCLGAALAIKLTAVFAVIAVFLVILLRARAAQNNETESSLSATRLLLKGTIALVCAGLLASPWYIRDWVVTGSPFFPFYLNIWSGVAPGWDAERSVLFQMLNSRYGGYPKTAVEYLLAPFAISLWAQPDSPEYFDGVLGVAFLFGLPLIVWAYRRALLKSELKIALLICGCLFVFWLFTSQQLRYLLPIFPALAVAIAFSCSSLAQENKLWRQTLVTILLCLSIASGSVTLAWFARESPLQVALGGESREDFLVRSLDYYPYYQIINRELPENSKIWLINMRRDTYHIDKPYFSDYMFEDRTFKQIVEESKSTSELQTKIKQMGITHVLVRHDVLLDYKQTVLVEDKRAEKDNMEKLKIARDFILNNRNVIRSDNRFSLIKVE